MTATTVHQRRADAALAAAMFVGTILSTALSATAGLYGDAQAPFGYAVPYAIALSLPLAFRRRWPGTVLVVVTVVAVTAVSLRIPETYALNIAIFIAFYTVGAWDDDRRRAHVVRIVVTAGMLVWLLITTFVAATEPSEAGLSRAGAFSPFVAFSLLALLTNGLFFGGAYYFGERTYQARMQRRALEQRTLELQREREHSAQQAVALDRLRIARELHDVVAHHVSLMGVQAGAARAVLEKDPDAARAALATIEESARSGIGELRQLLQTLREPEALNEPGTAPSTAGVAMIPRLAAEATAGGLPTGVAVIGTARSLTRVVELTLYRVVQEALTNARRHAGAGATADVRVRYLTTAEGDEVEVEVSNSGRLVTRVGDGMGLRGIRERAAICDGSAEIGPRPEGGFLVRVRVPAAPAARAAIEPSGEATHAVSGGLPGGLSGGRSAGG